jgi:hypothetical protein
MGAGLTNHVADLLEAETSGGESRHFLRFPSVQLAMIWFWRQHRRRVALSSQSLDFKDYEPTRDPVRREREQRTFAALLICFQDTIKGELPNKKGERPRFTDEAYGLLWDLWMEGRTQQYVAEEAGVCERTIDRLVARACDALAERLRRRGLLRGGGR